MVNLFFISPILNVTRFPTFSITTFSFGLPMAIAYQTGDPAGELAQNAADIHRQWLSFYWDSYTKEAHTGVAQMYVDDERFMMKSNLD